MTRKHYVKLAQWANEQKFSKELVDSLVDAISEFNPQFDEERFKKAAGQ